MCASKGIPDVPRVVGFNRPSSGRYAMGRTFLVLVFLAWPHILSAADFTDFLQDNDPQAIVSDKDATTFFLKTFDASLELPKGLLPHRRTPPPLPKELTQHLSPFVANLATWHLTHDLLTALAQGKTSLIQSILEQRQRQIEWLKQTQSNLPGLLTLLTTIAQLHPPEPSTPPLAPRDAAFTQFLHTQYPDWTGTPDSWLTLAQTEGAEGVQKRLRNSWERRPIQDSRHEAPDPAPSIKQFLRQSFLPIATAHVKADLLQLQVRNERQAWTAWQAI